MNIFSKIFENFDKSAIVLYLENMFVIVFIYWNDFGYFHVFGKFYGHQG